MLMEDAEQEEDALHSFQILIWSWWQHINLNYENIFPKMVPQMCFLLLIKQLLLILIWSCPIKGDSVW